MDGLDLIPVLLLGLLLLFLACGGGMIYWVLCWRKKHAASATNHEMPALAAPVVSQPFPIPNARLFRRPTTWMAIRGRSLYSVQKALGLHDTKLCTWTEGLLGEERLFIAPPVNGWILVIGPGLPDAAEDIDACFRCLLELSRKLGRVQLFSAVRALGHHTWARVEAGRVVRAYAWAGETLWNQGVKTRAELELGMKCFQYFESPQTPILGHPDIIAANTEKVPLLAARWSLDPAAVDGRIIERVRGVAGEPSRLY